MEASRDVSRLVEIMAALRSPNGGCPWDLVQDFDSIAPYTIEEAYEVADAIERRDAENLREELGDLLLQVVYHAQLAAEAKLFDFDDVVEGISKKMIRRHPHVFGDAEARSAGSANGHWERIKAEERAEREARRADLSRLRVSTGDDDASEWNVPSGTDARLFLDGVPAAFPALTLAFKVQEKAAKVGFDWEAAEPIREKIAEEFCEFDAAVAARDDAGTKEELGDLLFSLVNLARFHGVDPEIALRGCVSKFRRRFAYIERSLLEHGRTLEEASLDEMESLWIEAKAVDAAKSAGSADP